MDDSTVGVKGVTINASVHYPIVSAYEFEFLKQEAEVRDYLQPCTLYVILQRPLMVINGLSADEGVVRFVIEDGTAAAPLKCEIDLVEARVLEEDGRPFYLHAEFFKKEPDSVAPFNMVAGFKILDEDESFKAWFTAERFIYHFIKGIPGFKFIGDIRPYMDYQVHYVGKAFDQTVWKRLTGHEKMQKILTLEPGKNSLSLGAPFEISLMMIAIGGSEELVLWPYLGFPAFKDPILHDVSGAKGLEKFLSPWVTGPTAQLTNEAEAILIRTLKPAYNATLFENYPYIKNGARSLGYSSCHLEIEMMPAVLHTASATWSPSLTTGLLPP